MARSKTILQSQYPYHVTARSHNKERFKLPIDQVWKIMSRELYFLQMAYHVRIHAFVLLNNHFHLLLTTPEANIDKALWSFMSSTSRTINENSDEINQVYGSRYFKCVIDSDHYFLNAYKYVYRNPVHAGLSKRCEDYPYSTIFGLLGKAHLFIPVVEDAIMFPDSDKTLSWLNQEPPQDQWDEVSKAMQRSTFRLSHNSTYTTQYLNLNTL